MSHKIDLVVVESGDAALWALAECDRDFGEVRARTLQELRTVAGVEDARPLERPVGAIIPVLARSIDGDQRTFAVADVLIAAVTADAVVAVVRPVTGMGVIGPYRVPGSTAPRRPGVADCVATVRDLVGGREWESTAPEVAAKAIRILAESGARNVLEDVLREDLVGMESHAATILDVPHEEETDPDHAEWTRAVAAAQAVPRELQKLRAHLGIAGGRLDAADRERLDAWRFGLAFGALDPEVKATEPAIQDLRSAHTHVRKAAGLVARVRSESVDVLATAQAATAALAASVAEDTHKTTQKSQAAIAVLTAALAGPGLLFALWALDVFASPAWTAGLAALIAAGFLVLMWLALRRLSERDTSVREIAVAAVLVGGLVVAGLMLPKVGDPSAAERTRDEVSQIRDLSERQVQELEEVTRLLEEIRDGLEQRP